jgi:hypothetical protein
MIITNKRKVSLPKVIKINDKVIQVVHEFKLLGVTIDDKLKFDKYVSDVKKKVYCKLYSIKRLYQLSFDVKLQFFKTFILPHFDYCLSLCIYMNNQTLTRLGKMYYTCIKRLFKLELNLTNVIDTNCLLGYYNLFSYQHRVLYRLLLFIYKLKNDPLAPVEMKKYLSTSRKIETNMVLRPRKNLQLELVNNKFGEKTFFIFAKNLINSLNLLELFSLSFNDFKSTILNDFKNHNTFLNQFVNCFEKFYFTLDFKYL